MQKELVNTTITIMHLGHCRGLRLFLARYFHDLWENLAHVIVTEDGNADRYEREVTQHWQQVTQDETNSRKEIMCTAMWRRRIFSIQPKQLSFYKYSSTSARHNSVYKTNYNITSQLPLALRGVTDTQADEIFRQHRFPSTDSYKSSGIESVSLRNTLHVGLQVYSHCDRLPHVFLLQHVHEQVDDERAHGDVMVVDEDVEHEHDGVVDLLAFEHLRKTNHG